MFRSHASHLKTSPLGRSAVIAAVAASLIVASGIAIAVTILPFGSAFAAATIPLYLSGIGLMVARIETFHPHERFGLANAITLMRLAGTCLFAGLALELLLGAIVSQTTLWGFAVLAIVIVSLDGADGYLARRQGLVSDFGARFDHEVDTLMLLLLSLLAFLLGKAGIWVLLIGGMRYLFVAAGWIWPMLQGPLPYSLRRSAICVVQGLVLLALLMPIVTPPLSLFMAGGALVLLSASFAMDVMWLSDRSRQQRA